MMETSKPKVPIGALFSRMFAVLNLAIFLVISPMVFAAAQSGSTIDGEGNEVSSKVPPSANQSKEGEMSCNGTRLQITSNNFVGEGTGTGTGRATGFKVDSDFTIESVGVHADLKNEQFDFVIYDSSDGHSAGNQLYSISHVMGSTGLGWNDAPVSFTFQAGNFYVLNFRPSDGGSSDWANAFSYYHDNALPNTVGSVTVLEGMEGFDADNVSNLYHPQLRICIDENTNPPVIRPDPTQMPLVTLAPNDTTTQTLTLHNDGEGVLNATLSTVGVNAHRNSGNPQLISGKAQSESSITANRNAGSVNTKEVGDLKPVFKPLAQNLKVLYVNTMRGYDSSFISGLQGLQNIGTLDTLDAETSTPNVDYLLQYDVVVLASSYWFADSSTLGNNLADYVDAGGRVILLEGTINAGGDWALNGRIVTSDYSPLAVVDYDCCSNWSNSTSFESHPITQGVNSISTSLYAYSVSPQGNGQSLGLYDSGYLIGAYNPDKPIVAINVFPSDEYWSGDLIRLVGNALDWVAGSGSGWLSVAPTEVEIPAYGNVPVEVTYNATNLTEGDYSANIVIASNDPVNPEVTVPATLRVQAGLPPVMEVSPNNIEDTLQIGENSEHTLTFTNTGGSPLTYNLSTIETSVATNNASSTPNTRSLLTDIPDGIEYAQGELLVKLATGVNSTALISVRESVKATIKERIPQLNLEVWSLPVNNEADLLNAIKLISQDPRIEYAEPNYTQKAIGIPNDTRFDELWGMHNTGQTGGTADADIDAVEAWDTFTGNRDVVVAVIDTGVDYNHVDLVDNRWVNTGEIAGNGVDDDGNGFIDDVYGYDFAYGDSDPMDGHSHGTHCSGTVGGVGNNSAGVAGVTHAVRIMAVKFLSDSGSGSTANAIKSVLYAVDNGAQILSNSWGGGGFSQGLKDAISYANDNNVLFVAAAGNDYGNDNDVNPHYPSSYDVPNVLAVAATDHNDGRAWFSNYGVTSVDLGAPGVDTLSTVPGNSYASKSGTSMATPHVSGAAALLKGYNPSLTALLLKSIIMDSVDPVSSMAGKTVTGGRLNINNALNMAGTHWITLIGDTSGVIQPGASVNLTVRLDATGLSAGDYNAHINVDSNDPTYPQIQVPVLLHVEEGGPVYNLEVAKSGTGTGRVTSSPSGINCGTDCTEKYQGGTSVELTATPATNSVFKDWNNCPTPSGPKCTVIMDQDRQVTANFDVIETMGPVVLAVEPTVSETSVGQEFDVRILVNAYTQSVDGASAYLNFDPNYLEVVSMTGGGVLDLELENQFDNATGHINYSAGKLSEPYPSDTFELVTIRLKAIKTTEESGTDLSFVSDPPRSTNATFSGVSVFNRAENGTVKIHDAGIINGNVDLQGRQPAPHQSWETDLRVTFTVPSQTEPKYSFTTKTDYSGNFTVGPIDSAEYEMRVKGTHTLQNMLVVTATGDPVYAGELAEGDANDDNCVTISDFSILASTFGKQAGDSGFDSRADFNQDNFVTISDFSLLAVNFGICGDLSALRKTTSPAESSAVMAIVPTSTEVRVGDTFSVNVEIQAGTQQVDAASAYINFDPSFVKVDSLVAGDALTMEMESQFDNEAGTINFTAGTVSSYPSGTFKLVTINMTALAASIGTKLVYNYFMPRNTNITFGGASIFARADEGTIVIEPKAKAPIIGVNPIYFEVTQASHTQTTKSLTISNTGDLDLNGEISETQTTCDSVSDIPWLTTSLTTGIIPPGGNSQINVVFDSTGLAVGEYTGKLCINSNDPTTPLVEVPVSLKVTSSSDNSNDIIIDFGPQYGIWARMNNSTWHQIHTVSPEDMVVGNIDLGNSSDVIFDFGTQYGLWILMNNTDWVDLHNVSSNHFVTGDMDGNGKDEIIIDFGEQYGIWIRMNNTNWVQLHTVSSEYMTTGDIDANGKDDVIIDFGQYGIWIRMNNSDWVQLHTVSPESMTTGDIDGNGKDDVIIDFGEQYGIWIRMNNSDWIQLHSVSSEDMTTGDIDGNGKDDVIIDFGEQYGIWIRMNNTNWVQLHSVSSKSMTTGDIDTNGKEDVIIDFDQYGIWIRMNNSDWVQLHSISAEGMVTGNIDDLLSELTRSRNIQTLVDKNGPINKGNRIPLPESRVISLPEAQSLDSLPLK